MLHENNVLKKSKIATWLYDYYFLSGANTLVNLSQFAFQTCCGIKYTNCTILLLAEWLLTWPDLCRVVVMCKIYGIYMLPLLNTTRVKTFIKGKEMFTESLNRNWNFGFTLLLLFRNLLGSMEQEDEKRLRRHIRLAPIPSRYTLSSRRIRDECLGIWKCCKHCPES